MTSTFHIVIAMKPIEGTFAENALKHGVAGLAIDECRIGTFKNTQVGGMGNPSVLKTGEPARGNGFKGKPVLTDSIGRFPANVILSHSPECKCVGTKKVKGSFIEKPCPNPEIRGHKWGTMQGNRGVRGYGDKDGTETIQDWQCSDGCAVKLLGEQSGVTKSVVRPPTGKSLFSTDGTKPMKWNQNSTKDTIQRGHADSGTAARFFHAVTDLEIEEGGD